MDERHEYADCPHAATGHGKPGRNCLVCAKRWIAALDEVTRRGSMHRAACGACHSEWLEPVVPSHDCRGALIAHLERRVNDLSATVALLHDALIKHGMLPETRP